MRYVIIVLVLLAVWPSSVLAATYTTLTVTSVADSGTSPTSPTLATMPTGGNGNKFWNDGSTFLLFKNDTASTATVTIQTGATLGGLAIADRTLTVSPSGSVNLAGPFRTDVYNNKTGSDVGYVYLSSDVATKVYAFK